MDLIQQAMLAWLRLPVAAQGFIFVAIFVLYWLISESLYLLVEHCGHIKAVAVVREWWLFGDMPALEADEPAVAIAQTSRASRGAAPFVASGPLPPPKPEPLPPGFLDFDEDLGVVDTVENLQRLRQAASRFGTQHVAAQVSFAAMAAEAPASFLAEPSGLPPDAVMIEADGPENAVDACRVRRRAIGGRAGDDAPGQGKAHAQVSVSRHADGSPASAGRAAVPPTPMAGSASQAVAVA